MDLAERQISKKSIASTVVGTIERPYRVVVMNRGNE